MELTGLLLPAWITKLLVGPLETNSYILSGEKETWILDPGAEGNRIVQIGSASPARIILTHGHADHWGGVDEVFQGLANAELLYPKEDESLLYQADISLLRLLEIAPLRTQGTPITPPLFLEMDRQRWKLQATPGHTPGHMVLVGEGLLFSGDLLFRGGVGRTDLPGGSFSLLCQSLRAMLDFPDEMIVCPGHGPLTTIGAERLFLESLCAL
jgi:glyoxylase-like metal-dependent hydrolase (beta-lactamase superfamily II)